MKKSTVSIDLSALSKDQLIDPKLREGLSAATRSGKYLWIAGDEHVSVQRLEKTSKNRWGNCVTFLLGDYIELITDEDEMDIEGMDYDGKYLWIIGSHSYKRSNLKANTDNPEKEINKLSKLSLDPNRILMARIPCVPDENGEYGLHQSIADPDNSDIMLTAAKLKHGQKRSQLSKVLKKDKHLGPFMKIPGKDNGFDIEGLAAFEDRLFIGLRGPVLRGWAVILEVKLSLNKKNMLKLDFMNRRRERYIKHFLDLHGMGVRELATDGNDLLILAGPTMDLDGNMAIYRWKNVLSHSHEHIIAQDDIEKLVLIPTDQASQGIDKAEGMVMLEDHSLLVLYDSPGKERLIGKHGVKADVFHL